MTLTPTFYLEAAKSRRREIDEGDEGAIREAGELQEGVYLDAGADGRTFGIEFLDLDNFREWLTRHGGRVEIPERVEDLSLA